jgi:hypothetical protein
MKTAIKIFLMSIILIMFTTCDKEEQYMGEGVITGYDPRDCVCCGGLLINLNSSSTELFTDSTFQVDLVPTDFIIDTNTIFPMFIKLDYSRNNKLCGKTIDILKFERK